MLYKTLRNKIDMWYLITSLTKKKQAILLLDKLKEIQKQKSNLGFNSD